MARKISQFSPAVSVDDADELPIVQSGVTKRVQVSVLQAGLGGGAGTAIDTDNTTVVQGYAEVDTEDDTPETITFTDAAGGADFSTIALPDDSRVTIDVNVVATQAGGAKSKSYTVRRSFIISGSSVVTANAQLNLVDAEEVGGSMSSSVAIDYTGTNARVDWTGIAGTDIRTRFDIQAITVTAMIFDGSAPTVSSVTQDIADPDGGSTHVIAGTGFTGATALTIGGTDVPSFTVDSDIQITFTAPARAAGASLSVVVTNPSGSNGANTLFEYWAPEQLALTLFLDKVKSAYGGTTWAGIASAGSSGGRDVTQSTPGARPTNSSGEPDFDGTDDYLDGNAESTIADLFGSSQGTVLFIYDSDAQDAPSAPHLDPALFSDSGSYIAVYENTDGINGFVLEGGSRKIVTVAAGTGTRRVGMMRFNGSTITLSLGASIDADSTACGDLDAAADGGYPILGTNYSTAAFFDGRIRTLATLDGAIGDATYTKFRKWAQAARGAA